MTIIILTPGQERLLLALADLPDHLLLEPGPRTWVGRQLEELGLAYVYAAGVHGRRVTMAPSGKGLRLAADIRARRWR